MADIRVKTQKTLKVGNSVALTIDAEFVRSQHIESGDTFVVRYASDGIVTLIPAKKLGEIARMEGKTIQEQSQAISSKITPELVEWTKNFLAENEEAMRELANLS